MRHGPCSAITGVSEASNRRGHPIPVVGGLASQPLVTSRVKDAQAIELGRLFHLGGAAFLFGVDTFDQIDKSHQKAPSLLAGQLADRSPGISCLLYTSPSPRDATLSRMPSSA